MPPRIGMQRFLSSKLQNDCSFFETEQIAKLCSVGEKTQCLHFFLGKELSDIQNGSFPLC